ncbi:oxidoreductase [bacterium]|nr:MAG: oxidoreductase [bacterium]
MKQVLENSRTGVISLPEIPAPSVRRGMVLVANQASLISAGTEAAMIKFAKQNLLQKAKSRPDLVKQVMRKVQADGLMATYKTVQDRLDVPVPLGYSSAGIALEVGAGVPHIASGDRVACAGAGYANHAEINVVPKNLVVKIPDNVSFEDASFSTTGAIALQGIRVSDVRVGERVVVLGLGLIGLLTVQLLKAAGCFVMGFDLSPARVKLAKEMGADETFLLDENTILEIVEGFTKGRGADAVLITAATDSSGPVEIAGEICRMKGRVVIVGQVGMNVPRRAYYHKELELRLSMSYGPGRYDPNYEERGIDYPYAYVPFTEQNNLETFLMLVSEGKVTPQKLITHRFAIEDAEKAYAIVKGEVKEPYLGLIFSYPDVSNLARTVPNVKVAEATAGPEKEVRVGVIGAGQYARAMLLPKLKGMEGVELVGVATSRGMTSGDAADKFGFGYATTENEQVLNDPKINLIVAATRHDTHARFVVDALNAGKNVFVEKPLATNDAELRQVVEAAEKAGKIVQVGFNRRFAPLIQKAKEKFEGHAQPLSMMYRVNSGMIPSDHWHQDASEGGGRIVGEGCHFIDLMQFMCGSEPVAVYATSISGNTGAMPAEDVATITVRFADGSIGTLHYFSNGDKAVQKEYLEVFGGGKTFILNDFKSAKYAEGGKVTEWKLGPQDKGQMAEMQALVAAIKAGKPAPIPLRESVLTSLTTYRALDSMKFGVEVAVDWGPEGEAVLG